MNRENPFDATRASDFSDKTIQELWVDFPISGGFDHLIKPTSLTPMIIKGGKGSGKTHLMRHFSYQLQKLRSSGLVTEQIKEDGYVGIYFVCGVIDADRFSGKSISEDIWAKVFSFYIDICLSQLVIEIIINMFNANDEYQQNEKDICYKIKDLFSSGATEFISLNNVLDFLKQIKKDIDAKVNNCVITKELNVKILSTPGTLIFGVPAILVKYLKSLNKINFLYLIDEFENLNGEQQKYINSLIRERKKPCALKVGGRLYGFRSRSTYGEEDIKEGSEYEKLELLRNFAEKKEYKNFAIELCWKRLEVSGFLSPDCAQSCAKITDRQIKIKSFFIEESLENLGQESVKFIIEKYKNVERPYLQRLRNSLEKIIGSFDISSKEKIDEIINNIALHDFPLAERCNVFLFYKEWHESKNKNASLIKTSMRIAQGAKQFIESRNGKTVYGKYFNYWKQDLIAQILRECGKKQKYIGFDTFVELSHGIPRALLVILRNIYRWSIYNGEKPFEIGCIAVDSQISGVIEAADWFLEDARQPHPEGRHVRESIDRLGELFRDCRFSDKPVEVSCAGFSVDYSKLTDKTKEILDLAVSWSLLVENTGGQRDRSSKRIDSKYVLNKALSPKWDLPSTRRGTMKLTPEEVDSIFDPANINNFNNLRKKRVLKMTAPFKKEMSDDSQKTLF